MAITLSDPPARPEHDRRCGTCNVRHTKAQLGIITTWPGAPVEFLFTLCGHVAAPTQP